MTENHLCPRDSGSLEPRAVGPAEIRVCSVCQGIWISPTDLRDYLRWPVDQSKLPQPEDLLSDFSALDDSVNCVCNTGVMMKTTQRGGVTVDVCPKCNAVWFDGGEIQELLRKRTEESDPEAVLPFLGLESILFLLRLVFGP